MPEVAPPLKMTVPDGSSRRSVWLAAALIAVAAFAVYANSFRGPFILDDLPDDYLQLHDSSAVVAARRAVAAGRWPDRQQSATRQPLAGNQLRSPRLKRPRLPSVQLRDPPACRADALWPDPADAASPDRCDVPPHARVAHRPGRRAPLDRSSAQHRVGHLHRPARRIPRGPALSVHVLRVCAQRGVPAPRALASRGRRSVSARNGDEGDPRFRAAARPALRSHVCRP